MNSKQKYNLVDLFCGAGGLHIDFSNTDKFNTILCLDNDEELSEYYKSNFPDLNFQLKELMKIFEANTIEA